MQSVLLKGVLFHVLCLILFTLIYFALYESHFENIIEKEKNNLPTSTKFVDCFYFSTTVEAGVGLTSLQPTTHISKILVSVQQILMIIGNIFILYLSFKAPKHVLKKFERIFTRRN